MVASVNDRKTEKMILADIYLLKINNINTRNVFKVIKKNRKTSMKLRWQFFC